MRCWLRYTIVQAYVLMFVTASNQRLRNMLIGYARVSKADGSQSLDLQHDDLRAAGVEQDNIYEDRASGGRDDRPGLAACLKSLRAGDVLVVWKLDRLGRSLAHLVNTVKDLSDRNIGLRVLTGKGAQIDTTTASGRMVFGIFATLAEFERDLIRERTMAGLAAARARGRKGGRKFALTKAQVRLAQAAMAQRDTSVSDLCKELGIERVTLYRYVGPKGELRDYGKRVLGLDPMTVIRLGLRDQGERKLALSRKENDNVDDEIHWPGRPQGDDCRGGCR